ncbi:transmembrane protein 183-like [Schistocerca americana]|uniref:transmembrane protein 183-like n=1 Tax=Schistocerca americana TaxID=7009 RepID=UPI001F4F92EA|nr:transmembrane protein 183-like [Schistocerca americana]
MNIGKRQLDECEQSEPLDMSLNKRARDEPVINESLDMRLEEGQDPSLQNCPLDLSMGKRKSDGIIKSPVSSLHGLKKTEAVVNDDLSLGIEKSDGVSVSPVSSLQELKKTEKTVGLDLSMGGRKSAVSSLRGVKKSNTTVQGERAATSEEVIKIPCVVEEPGVRYPLDVWFLIADYIVPESVGKFARICKDSLHVTYTAIFWCKLFKRYCTDGRITEASFKVVRKQRGLRTRVIRSLHRIYKPLAMKRETDLNPPMLLNRLIRSQWVESNRRGTEWIYHFELYDFYNKSRWKPEKFDEWWNDITVNQSAYCVMLKITSSREVELPKLQGLVLREIILVKMENTMTKIKCILHSCPMLTNKEKKVFIFQTEMPILRTRVLNWWSPYYPRKAHCPLRG